MALLACPRSYWQVGSAREEPVDEAAETQQVVQRADK